jgi:oligosaccharide repeat unit polymerase
LFSLQGLLAFATMATSERYAMEAPPRLSQALLPFVFLGPMLGGILFGESRSRSRFQALWGLLPGMLIAVTQTAKAGTIFAGLLFVAGYCTAQVRWHRYHLLSWRRVGLALAVVLAFTAFMYFVTLSRGGQLDPALLEVANLKLRSALVGHMAVFSDWLQGYPQNTPDPSWGKYTFAGPAEALGLTTRIGGLFETTYFLSFGESSNIYTVFRPLIQDFTIPGALAFLLLLGLAGGAGYRAVGHGKWWAAPLLLIFYAVTIDSPITSLLAYNSQIAATGALAAVLLLTPYLPGRWPSRWLRRKPYQPLVGVNEGFRRGNRGHSA